MQILIYGYGNPGRQDDGLGNEFVNRMEQWASDLGLENFQFESNYQLNIEDAEAISDKDLVIFADASEEEIEDFCISKVDESTKVAFTTHAASPGYIVKLCTELFNKNPLVLLLHIKGYQWEFKEEISDQASDNLDKAFEYMKIKLNNLPLTISSPDNLKMCK
ncbi:MAG: hydrogenase maturation protease [Bacteroidota bacterium]|nr:hydrogenase maturation protease [Bacteroidota bacterium]